VRGKPRPPDWLDRVGKHAFRWLVKHLDQMGVLTLSDSKALERYCQIYARWREAEALLRVHGQVMLVKREDGSEVPRKNPAVAIASDLSHQLARLEADLGLTPASRAGLMAQGQMQRDDDDPFGYFTIPACGSGT
jgi:P27 family predicted phage terminase small subunit